MNGTLHIIKQISQIAYSQINRNHIVYHQKIEKCSKQTGTKRIDAIIGSYVSPHMLNVSCSITHYMMKLTNSSHPFSMIMLWIIT